MLSGPPPKHNFFVLQHSLAARSSAALRSTCRIISPAPLQPNLHRRKDTYQYDASLQRVLTGARREGHACRSVPRSLWARAASSGLGADATGRPCARCEGSSPHSATSGEVGRGHLMLGMARRARSSATPPSIAEGRVCAGPLIPPPRAGRRYKAMPALAVYVCALIVTRGWAGPQGGDLSAAWVGGHAAQAAPARGSFLWLDFWVRIPRLDFLCRIEHPL